MRPDLSKQVKIYPVGGLNTEVNNELVSLVDATVLLNADFENARTGCVKKRKPVYRISEPPLTDAPSYYAMFYHKTDELNERIYYLVYGNYSNHYKVWANARLFYSDRITGPNFEAPFTAWIEVHLSPDTILWNYVARAIIYNPTKYKQKKDDTSNISFFYAFGGSDKQPGRTRQDHLTLQIERSIENGHGGVSVYPLILQNHNATWFEYTLLTWGMQTFVEIGYYSYYFLFEDVQGNIEGSFLETEPKNYYHVGEVHVDKIDHWIHVKITVTGYFHHIGKKIHIFRTTKSSMPRAYRGEYPGECRDNYYYITSIDIVRDKTSYEYDDKFWDTYLLRQPTMETYFNDGLHPDGFIWLGVEEGADCGCIHQGRLYIMYKNRIRWSLTNKHRSFITESLIDLDTFGYGCQLVSMKNALVIFTDIDIWIWYGNSSYEMDAVKPYRIHNTGLFHHGINVPNDNTAQVWNDMVLFVDSNGYPKVIAGDTVRYLSDDGTSKIKIDKADNPGNRSFDATIVKNEYRVTNYEKVYVCSLTKGYQWLVRDIPVRRFLYPNMQLTHTKQTVYTPIGEFEERIA